MRQFQRVEAQFLEVDGVRLEQPALGHVGQGGTGPHAERPAEGRGRLARTVLFFQIAAFGDEPLDISASICSGSAWE